MVRQIADKLKRYRPLFRAWVRGCCHVLGEGDMVNDPGYAEGGEGAGDEPEMAERDVGSFDEVSERDKPEVLPKVTRISRGLMILPNIQISAKSRMQNLC